MAFRAFRLVASRPWAFSAVGRLGRVVAPMLFSRSHLTAAGRLIARAVAPLAAWAATRDVRPIPARSFRESWRAGGSASERAAGAHVDATLAGRTVQGPAPALPDPATAPTDLVASFVSAVESVAGTCTVVASQEGAVDAVNAFIRSRNARRVAVSDSAFARAVVGQCAVDELVGTDAAALFTADIGVTSAQWGIAETGTLVLASRAEHHRLASLVPTAHVALLDARGLRGTLGEVLFEIGPGGHDSLGNCITFITGPSRTSDIELTPALGVHGPTALHVVVLAEPRDRTTDTRLGKTEGR
jgi:L-lactate dehydrogenase complex protein LldG